MRAVTEQTSLAELVELSAVDSALFASVFFPKTTRQKTPPFLREVWELLEDPSARLVNVLIFRGGAKTSTLRMYTAKRIAYGLAHTILYVGKSEGHAARSIKWLRRQVEYNKLFAGTFGLRKGSKWQDTEAEVWHGTDEYPVWIMGLGITGSIRGINMDDFRPDLIVIDDVMDEENSATPEQRQKTNALIYGALKESLAPASEAPDAKMVMLQTPLNREDASSLAANDPEWRSARFGCWTAETADMPVERQESIWPERWTSPVLRAEKAAAAHRNQLSIFLREKECKIVSPETSAFRPEWLKYFDLAPEGGTVVMAIDPVPPPSDLQIAKGLRGKDYETIVIVKRHKADFYLLDYSMNRGHEPDWTVMEVFRLWLKYHPRKVVVEATAYQRTLAWLLRKAMEHQRRYFLVEEITDQRKKFDRIVDALTGPAAAGHLYVRREHTDFIQQFNEYPDVPHEDVLDAVATGLSSLMGLAGMTSDDDLDEWWAEIEAEEREIAPLRHAMGAP